MTLQITFDDLKLSSGGNILSCDQIRKADNRVCLSDALQHICQIHQRHHVFQKIGEIRNNNHDLEEHLLCKLYFEETGIDGSCGDYEIMVDPLGFVAFFNRINDANVMEFKKLNDRIFTTFRLIDCQTVSRESSPSLVSSFKTDTLIHLVLQQNHVLEQIRKDQQVLMNKIDEFLSPILSSESRDW